ncbi:LacI family DNA-binding transcriptional regulator [Litorihabitans aurantiacus]|uniref:LacI family transcriptional regulator n=1 Tax=Litorihabitans aurantiacus TaxID=1930061 RepID=A0AA37XI03_9MICO|nr:LacI family DNA-binding transcriptional regulator [Litorihabitans aurantiacus]GMA33394.1 LacI family transcriptional regulator [Litorihabitans aurantiacus]
MSERPADEDRPAPTIYDVARAAGVAPSTVSRALSRPGRVSTATAEKVHAAALELGYRRASVGPVLTSVPTRMLAMVVADIGNPQFVDVVRGATAAAEAAGYTMLLVDAQESDVREREAASTFLDAVDGLILTSPRLSDSGIRGIAKRRPVIVLNRIVSGLPSVLTDGARGVRRAAEHLGQLGHREITYVAGPEASWADGVRWRGLEEAGLELDMRVRRIGPNAPTVEGGARAARRWAQRPTTAVVAFNDVMAVGFVRGLRALGVAVPGEVSVVGFDNSAIGALTAPSLTSVASPLQLQGSTAVRNLLAIVGGARSSGEPVLLPVKLVVRDSTARAARSG